MGDDDGLCAKCTVYHDEMISLVCCRQSGIKSAKTLMRISYLSVLSGWRAWDNFIVVCRLCHTRESHQWFKEAQSSPCVVRNWNPNLLSWKHLANSKSKAAQSRMIYNLPFSPVVIKIKSVLLYQETLSLCLNVSKTI